MRLRFSVTGKKADEKEQAADAADVKASTSKTSSPEGETVVPADATNNETKIEAATDN
jgi:hypothetical protein